MKATCIFSDRDEELIMDDAPRLFKGDVMAFATQEAPDTPFYYVITGVVYSLVTKEMTYYFDPKV